MQVLLYNITVCPGNTRGGTVTDEVLYLHGDVQRPLVTLELFTTKIAKQHVPCINYTKI